ncbi:Uncharacterised protein [Mycobacteroides abscessus subsp. abscessus]|nr:Uncharacterised protein [Mycobacteroides abscessus subsp. abscessus]
MTTAADKSVPRIPRASTARTPAPAPRVWVGEWWATGPTSSWKARRSPCRACTR